MARSHICFVQSQSIAWASDDGAFGPARSKMLSQDDANGSYTAITQWINARTVNLNLEVGAELYVLQGGGELEGHRFDSDAYLFIAPNQRTQIRFDSETVALVMTGAKGVVLPAHSTGSCAVDTYALPWTTGAEGSVTGKPLSPTIFTKKLRHDPNTDEQTFLYTALPQHGPPSVMPGKFAHPVVEEIFTLAGEYVFGDTGRMGPGGYVWWRENEYHGPAGSAGGYNLLIRVHEGPLTNTFSKESSPFSFYPEHAPSLPNEHASHASPYPFPPRW